MYHVADAGAFLNALTSCGMSISSSVRPSFLSVKIILFLYCTARLSYESRIVGVLISYPLILIIAIVFKPSQRHLPSLPLVCLLYFYHQFQCAGMRCSPSIARKENYSSAQNQQCWIRVNTLSFLLPRIFP